MAGERATLLATATSLSAAAADHVPEDAEGEEQWTAKEQLSHLWEMERRYIATCRLAVEGDEPNEDWVAGEAVDIPIEKAPQHTVAEIVNALVDEREASVRFIHKLTLPDFHRTVSTSAFGELTVMQWLRSFYRHDRQHAAQIAGRESDYKPNFQPGVGERDREPNQRRARIEKLE